MGDTTQATVPCRHCGKSVSGGTWINNDGPYCGYCMATVPLGMAKVQDGVFIHPCPVCAGLRAELETERMRVVACDVVAMADTPDSAAKARDMKPEYRSAALDSVIRRVDECIALRTRLARVEGALERIVADGERKPGPELNRNSITKIASDALRKEGGK